MLNDYLINKLYLFINLDGVRQSLVARGRKLCIMYDFYCLASGYLIQSRICFGMRPCYQINNSGNGLLFICFNKIGFSSNLCPKDHYVLLLPIFPNLNFSHVACVLCIWFPNSDLFVQYNILHNPYI